MTDNQYVPISQKNLSVLIAGGSGLIGKYLTSVLLERGYKVSHLSRNVNQFGRVRVFRWDPQNKIVDPVVFDGIDYIINLAGANIGEKRWTKIRKDEIIASRTETTRLLYNTVADNKIQLKAFISASAIGYYGSVTSDNVFKEDDPPANDFLGTTCRLWEEAADLFTNMGIRSVKIRTAVVLEKSDSALSKMMKTGKYGFVVQSGNGRQFMPWVHINDLCNIYLKAIEDPDITGAYNAVSPQHITNKDFMIVLARVMKLSLFPIPVPALVLKVALGEMSDIILKGSRVSSEKLINSGFVFSFTELENSLYNIIYGSGPVLLSTPGNTFKLL